MLEIIGCAATEDKRVESEKWALSLWNDFGEVAEKEILDHSYISLQYSDEMDSNALRRFFGSHVDEILSAKKRYDPENVFDLTVPRLSRCV